MLTNILDMIRFWKHTRALTKRLSSKYSQGDDLELVLCYARLYSEPKYIRTLTRYISYVWI